MLCRRTEQAGALAGTSRRSATGRCLLPPPLVTALGQRIGATRKILSLLASVTARSARRQPPQCPRSAGVPMLCVVRPSPALFRVSAAAHRSRQSIRTSASSMAGGGSSGLVYPKPIVFDALQKQAKSCLIMLHGLGKRVGEDHCRRRRCRRRHVCAFSMCIWAPAGPPAAPLQATRLGCGTCCARSRHPLPHPPPHRHGDVLQATAGRGGRTWRPCCSQTCRRPSSSSPQRPL